MRHTSTALFVTNGLILKKSGKLWIYPSQDKQLELLDKFHDINIVARTLRYHHLNHINAGLTKRRVRRLPRDDGTWYMQTTARCYTISGYKYLNRLGNPWAKDRIKTLIQKYGPKSDGAKRPLKEDPPAADDSPPDISRPTDLEDP